ncbi:gephyrin-like molybdotransferase Glp [Polymorphum gilvum]|uniref:Molybdopterin molybdenumtransferase n=1 Tax=Polymorphum gilvum (strain LMG 25793 / CGMCC 1.9160 / SL003B-26A1) TaxID=991905 RepID=F2J5Y6_POLGS|nr:gephyrin-like molybdotransferase Glp [Polymorphum gilvum]ADZ71240.1 Molybdopterin biosynthesis protein [Polymorphum gilvum SL003B-26A1]
MAERRRLLDDCFVHGSDSLRHDEALAILRREVTAVARAETVPLTAANGRYLAEAVTAPRDVPLADNSAVDGYAFRHADHDPAGGFFRLETRIAAGHPSDVPLGPWAAARIFTGAVMPPGADTVAMQEDCERHDQDGQAFVVVPAGLKPGANRRRAGEDVKAGSVLLEPGRRLRPQDVAAIASTGKTDVAVYRRLRVALMSSGDELRRPGEAILPGQVYDANHYLLRALVEAAGAEPIDLGILPDRADSVQTALEAAAAGCDVLLTTGGASHGEEDHITTTLDRLGTRCLWPLAIKPGRSMAVGRIDGCVFLGLPGNPVAAMVCFLLYARPVLSVLGGGAFGELQRFQVIADFEIARKKPGRREFHRGTLGRTADGRTCVHRFERDGSGLISGLSEADGLIEIDEETTAVARGSQVDFIPFGQFGIAAG